MQVRNELSYRFLYGLSLCVFVIWFYITKAYIQRKGSCICVSCNLIKWVITKWHGNICTWHGYMLSQFLTYFHYLLFNLWNVCHVNVRGEENWYYALIIIPTSPCKFWKYIGITPCVCLSVGPSVSSSCGGHNYLLSCRIWILFYTIDVHDPRVCQGHA